MELSVSSLGYEARLELREKHFREAINLYLQQAVGGDPSAILSLRFSALRALEQGSSALRPLARDPTSQKVITAYAIDAGWTLNPIDIDLVVTESLLNLMQKVSTRVSLVPAPKPGWHHFQHPVLLWLEAVEAAGVKDVEAAEQLALAAYQVGDMMRAQRWLSVARPTPVAQWLRAKLLLREGKVDAAAALLASVCRLFPVASATNGLGNTLADNLYLRDGEFPSYPSPRRSGVRWEFSGWHAGNTPKRYRRCWKPAIGWMRPLWRNGC